MKVTETAIYRVGDMEIDVAQNCLRRNGAEQHLRPKSFQVLLYLLENRARVVPKEELMERLWTDTAVTDDALVQCLIEIRKAFGDDSRRPRFIKTIPKVGYRFINSVAEDAPQKVLSSEPENTLRVFAVPLRSRLALVSLLVVLLAALGLSLAAWQRTRQTNSVAAEPALPQMPGKKSLLVMRFENRSGDAEFAWLREGLADMLITNLSRSNKLFVLSRQQFELLLSRTGRDRDGAFQLAEALNVAQKKPRRDFHSRQFCPSGRKDSRGRADLSERHG